MKKIKKLLKKYRAEEIAVHCGVSYSTVRNWYKGRNVPSRMAENQIDKLLGGDDVHDTAVANMP